MTAERAWRNVAPGVFLLGFGIILARFEDWQWVFVLLCGMSVVKGVLRRNWAWLVHPLAWGAGLSWSYATGKVSGWAMFLMLCGASLLLSFLLSLVPKPPPPPPRPGSGTVIDV